jgi:uncharacterized protein (TIGR04255 family)
MSFSNFHRSVYKKNVLVQVVCQLRFPRILMINEKSPAEFQERIRGDYPLFQVAVEQQQQIAMDIGGKEPLPTPRIFQSESVNNYKFSSADDKWHVNLTSTFMALSTSSYDRWENFEEHLKKPLDALLEIYRLPFFERIGLRYVDAFKRSLLNLNDVPWTDLIEPFALGFMSDSEIGNTVRNQSITAELDIGKGAMAQINSAKGYIGDKNLGVLPSSADEAFIVDSDMYMLRTNTDEIDAALAYLHDYSTRLIRLIITDKLHEAMEPSEI